jgi:hypothetical protein
MEQIKDAVRKQLLPFGRCRQKTEKYETDPKLYGVTIWIGLTWFRIWFSGWLL